MAGKIRKTAGVLLLIAAIIFSQIPSKNVSAQDADFRMDGSVLIKYTGNDENIIIPDYVTVIGEEAFYDNDTVKSVEISNQVEEIKNHAFYGCDNLQQVTVGDSVETIENAAFAECTQLETVSFGENVNKIGNGIFSGCTLLKEIGISDDNKYLKCENGVLTDTETTHLYAMLNGCTTATYEIPDSIETISKYAFWGCEHLEYVDLSGVMKKIPAYAFSNCRGLQAVSVPYSVTDIGAKAFENCSALQVIDIPETVKTIHTTAFDGCGKLQIHAAPASYAQQYALTHEVTAISQAEYEEIRDYVLTQQDIQEEPDDDTVTNSEENQEDGETDSDTSIDDAVSETDTNPEQSVNNDMNASYINEEELMGQTVIVSGQAVVLMDNTTQSVYDGSVDIPLIYQEEYILQKALEQQPFGISKIEPDDELMLGTQTGKGIYVPKYAVVNNMIADQAYYGQNISSYDFQDDITEIGDFSFARSKLASVEIPAGVTHIGYGAFYHCDSLTQVTIPTTVTEIEPYAFENTPWLENWRKTEGTSDFLVVGDGVLLAYRGSDSKIEIPEGIKVIAPNCFEGHIGIVAVTFSHTVEEIGEEAFMNCSNLTTVNGGARLVSIADRAFAGCPVSTVKINEYVTHIGARAFDITNTVKDDDFIAVDFKGTTLPQVSYEDSATKWYHSDYRGLALEGVSAAIVTDKHIAIDGTILDPYVSGFRGFICTWYEDAPEGEKSLVIIKSTVPVRNQDEIEWPTEISLYGTTYPVAGVLDTAFSYYENTDWIEDSHTSNEIDLKLYSTVLTNPELSKAELPGNKEHMVVTVSDHAEAGDTIRQAYEELYHANDNMTCYGFSITAKSDSGIPIMGFGSNPLQITLAVPADMTDGLTYMLCLDESGQLEVVNAERMEIEGVHCIRFYAEHLSEYALCSFDVDESVSAGLGALDESPDTGDLVEPRNLLCVGMVALAVVLILWKTPKRKIMK